MLLAAACSAPCSQWGDKNGTPRLVITQRVNGASQEVTSGGALLLQVPPQGGYVAYVGARLYDFEGCRIDFSASLFEPDSGTLSTEERRRIDFPLAGEGGSGTVDPSDPAHFANVPVCPNFDTRDYPGLTWRLDVVARAQDGREVKTSLPVVPSCAGDANCECECRANYEFGKCSGAADAG